MPDGIAVEEANELAQAMHGPGYGREEIDCKVAVHTVLSQLLSAPVVDSPDVPRVLKSTQMWWPRSSAPSRSALGEEAAAQLLRVTEQLERMFPASCADCWNILNSTCETPLRGRFLPGRPPGRELWEVGRSVEGGLGKGAEDAVASGA